MQKQQQSQMYSVFLFHQFGVSVEMLNDDKKDKKKMHLNLYVRLIKANHRSIGFMYTKSHHRCLKHGSIYYFFPFLSHFVIRTKTHEQCIRCAFRR